MNQRLGDTLHGSSTTTPVIITCAITGDHQKRDHPGQPLSLEEQVAAAREATGAGASIIHLHGRRADDPTRGADDPMRYREINDAIRAACPGVLIDNTQLSLPLGEPPGLEGRILRYTAMNVAAGPDLMSLNPGPMMFRGRDAPGSSLVTTFDDTERTALLMREHGVKPQVFLYHPGHLDILHHLIDRGALAKPYWVQLVFGQQVGIAATIDAFAYMTRNLPADCRFQACALGHEAIRMNLLAMLEGGHVRTGMEDAIEYRPGEAVRGNGQLVERVARMSHDLGREIATPSQARALLGIH